MRQATYVASVLAAGLLGCSSGGARPGGNGADGGSTMQDLAMTVPEDAGISPSDAAGMPDLAVPSDGASVDLRPPADLATGPDLSPFMGILTVKIFASNTCKITTDPASITLPRGSTFTVNWQNLATSSYEVDVAKRDPFNLVPILIGLEIGNSYHDTIRSWCGAFSGTFWFRISTACGQYEIPVNC